MHPCQPEVNNIWFEKWRCDDAEKAFHMRLAGTAPVTQAAKPAKAASPAKPLKAASPVKPMEAKTVPIDAPKSASALVNEIATARQHILRELDGSSTTDAGLASRIDTLELENRELRKTTEELTCLIKSLETRLSLIETGTVNTGKRSDVPAAASIPVVVFPATISEPEPAAPVPVEETGAEEAEDDDDDDFFGSDDEEEDEEALKKKEERLAAYHEKKAKKPALIAKSSILLDVKPWDDETDMAEMERLVREVECEGLVWGASKLIPLAYGIKKLQICCVVEDDKVSTDWLEEQITGHEDHVQSMDIAAFNKI